ncbi:MAG: DUF6306 domain-containing protein [Candidatus Methylomirabilales bacterium]
MRTEEVIEKLNELLEAERAGVEACAKLAEGLEDEELKAYLFQEMKQDEAWSCAGLHKRITALGGIPSEKKGDFTQKVMALEGLIDRLNLLNRGQRWVVKRIDALLASELDEETRAFLQEMRKVHLQNIEWCDRKAQELKTSP